jgi:hypothetical protein
MLYACAVIPTGIVDKPADLDVAAVMAMGFPPYRGGLIFWADLVGAGTYGSIHSLLFVGYIITEISVIPCRVHLPPAD